METALQSVIDRCRQAVREPEPQAAVEAVLREAAADPVLAEGIAARTEFANLKDLAIHRSAELTLLAGALPPGFRAAPHNHNLWSVVSVLAGREDNEFFERDGAGLRRTGEQSVEAPGVLCNPAEVIHAICNPLETPLVVLHAYGGDLFAVERSNWDAETHEEIPFDWTRVRPNVE